LFKSALKYQNFIYVSLLPLFLLITSHYVYNSSNLALKGEKTIFNTDREDLYFIFRPNLKASYRNIVEQIQKNKCTKIYAKLQIDDWEYPLWRMLKNMKVNFEMYHTGVNNLTAPLEVKNLDVCGIVEIDNPNEVAKFRKY
ncbi:MAG: hypothetical protein ACK40K_02020, partial [Raineya sp.]